MTNVLTAAQVANVWLVAGGNPNAVQDALGVAYAESGFNADAVSAADDHGIWQINEANLPRFGVNNVTAREPLINARMAVAMSGNGTNWAAWCTCWVNPDRNCGHGYLPHPELGSPAGNVLSRFSGIADSTPTPTNSSAAASAQAGLESAWGQVQQFHGEYAAGRYASYKAMANALKGLTK